jgi:hypothetical protein
MADQIELSIANFKSDAEDQKQKAARTQNVKDRLKTLVQDVLNSDKGP